MLEVINHGLVAHSKGHEFNPSRRFILEGM